MLMCITMVGCNGVPTQNQQNTTEEVNKDNQVTFVDDLGRTVTVNNPQRVATLISSFADIWSLQHFVLR